MLRPRIFYKNLKREMNLIFFLDIPLKMCYN